jgi:hypothetical protein
MGYYMELDKDPKINKDCDNVFAYHIRSSYERISDLHTNAKIIDFDIALRDFTVQPLILVISEFDDITEFKKRIEFQSSFGLSKNQLEDASLIYNNVLEYIERRLRLYHKLAEAQTPYESLPPLLKRALKLSYLVFCILETPIVNRRYNSYTRIIF